MKKTKASGGYADKMLGCDFLPGELCLCHGSARLLCGGKDLYIDEDSAGLTSGTERREDGNTKDRWMDHSR